ncbi:gnt-II system L-idonate transporter [Niabella terrae]
MNPVVVLVIGILLLLLLIGWVKINAFTSLILTALFIGWAGGMENAVLLGAISKGAGDIMGSVIAVLGFGVMLGSLLTETGATRQISDWLLRIFGARRAKIAIAATSFCVGLALFYNAGFVVLIPLVYTVARQTGLPLTYLAISMAAPLSVTHGFLPPHPGPTVIAGIFQADIGLTLLYGLLVAVPVLILAAVLFPEWIKKVQARPPAGLFNDAPVATARPPRFLVSLLIALSPVLMLATATLILQLGQPSGTSRQLLVFISDPAMSLLIALVLALLFLGLPSGVKISELMNRCGLAINAIASIVFITAAGGALKQVLIASGTGEAITLFFTGSGLPPLLLGWLIATILRIAIGSATVAGLTAAGIVQPLVASLHVRPELMVLSIGAGSLMCSHVNDTGFWMFKEYLGLSLKDTFRTWTLMESVIGLAGLIGVLLLNSLL